MTAEATSRDAAGPISSATHALTRWLEEVAGMPVRQAPPQDPADPGTPDPVSHEQADGSPALTVWPLQLRAETELRSARRREPLRFQVRHLVAGPAEALDRALTEATVRGEPTVELAALDDHAWLALRRLPRIALLIDVPAVVDRPTPEGPLVTEPLRLELVDKNAQEES